jgi:Fe2+ or Zn2+ uptake regulation protein
MGSRKHRLLKMSWEKLTRNAPSRSPSKNTTYKMLEELVESELVTELEIREGKNEAESVLKRLMDA